MTGWEPFAAAVRGALLSLLPPRVRPYAGHPAVQTFLAVAFGYAMCAFGLMLSAPGEAPNPAAEAMPFYLAIPMITGLTLIHAVVPVFFFGALWETGGILIHLMVLGWYGLPTVFLAWKTAWLPLVAPFVHTLLSPPGTRLWRLVHYGATNFALVLGLITTGVADARGSGTYLLLLALVLAQAVPLTFLERYGRRFWTVHSGRDPVRVIQGIWRSVLSISFSPRGDLIAFVTGGPRIRFRETRTGKRRGILRTSYVVRVLASEPGGDRVVWGDQAGAIGGWAHGSQEPPLLVPTGGRCIEWVAPLPGKAVVAAGDGDSEVMLVETHPGGGVRRVPSGLKQVDCGAASGDGSLLAVGARGVGFRVLETGGGNDTTGTIAEPELVSLALSPSEGLVAAGRRDGRVRVWSLSPVRDVVTVDLRSFAIPALAFSPDGRRLATGHRDGFVSVLDRNSWKVVAVLPIPDHEFTALAWSPDGLLAVGGTSVRVWDVDAMIAGAD